MAKRDAFIVSIFIIVLVTLNTVTNCTLLQAINALQELPLEEMLPT